MLNRAPLELLHTKLSDQIYLKRYQICHITRCEGGNIKTEMLPLKSVGNSPKISEQEFFGIGYVLGHVSQKFWILRWRFNNRNKIHFGLSYNGLFSAGPSWFRLDDFGDFFFIFKMQSKSLFHLHIIQNFCLWNSRNISLYPLLKEVIPRTWKTCDKIYFNRL